MLNTMPSNTLKNLSSLVRTKQLLSNSLQVYGKNPSLHNWPRHFHSVQDDKHSWSILNNFYHKQTKGASKGFACFLLNITDGSFKHFERYKYIWDAANLKVAVDGSANTLARKKIIHTADVVCGDFDSVEDKLIQQLRNPTRETRSIIPSLYQSGPLPRLPQVIETFDQKETDFTKAIRVAMDMIPKLQFFFGLYQSNGTRIDQLFGLINTLHLIKKNIILVNIKSNTISWLLVPGTHVILKPKGRELCSLVPFTGPTQVKTRGLEYNIGASYPPIQFGGIISTSNICLEDCESITIDTDRELLWSIDVRVPEGAEKLQN